MDDYENCNKAPFGFEKSLQQYLIPLPLDPVDPNRSATCLALKIFHAIFCFGYCPKYQPMTPLAVADNGRGLMLRVITKNAFSYMLSNEMLRFLSEIEIDITTGGH